GLALGKRLAGRTQLGHTPSGARGVDSRAAQRDARGAQQRARSPGVAGRRARGGRTWSRAATSSVWSRGAVMPRTLGTCPSSTRLPVRSGTSAEQLLATSPPRAVATNCDGLANWRVGEDHHAVWTNRLAVDQPQGERWAAVAEQAFAGAEHDWKHHKSVLVDQAVLGQAPSQLCAAGDEDVSGHLAFEPRNLTGHVVSDNRRVGPRRVRVAQRRRDHILGHAVHLLAELVRVHRRPRLGESRVGDPPEQLRVGCHQFVDLELVAIIATVELEGPTAFLKGLAAAWRFDDAIQGDELGDD